MKKQKIGSCTTMLVGKDASIDGSTLIARSEDGAGDGANPKRFVVVNPTDQPREYHSVLSPVVLNLPEDPLRYTSTPEADLKSGLWAAAGINSDNVAMSATETITTNSRILGVDPLVEDGLGEENFVTITLPYIHSAREGVQRLGALLEAYGTYESNGIAFSDQEEVWYFESIGGHHWAAIRIPDDAYVIAPNRFNIDHFDFDSDDTLFAADLPDLINTYHLNPDPDEVNLRHIFGSATVKDTHYNNPRAWFGQQYLNPEIKQDPFDQDLPFICHTAHKITVEDMQWILCSHYQNTVYDPYGISTEAQQKLLRPIGINRNHETHILQIRSDVPADIAGIHWLAFGPNTFNALIPFYANVTDTPAAYRDTPKNFDLQSVYWLSRATGIFGDTNYDLYSDLADQFKLHVVADCRYIQKLADAEFDQQKDISAFLQAQNQKMADLYFTQAMALFGKMTEFGATKMKLRYNLND
ncbi:C69 family dipeptidase [Agrilactobacillus fermenti]|uniref:C69 family dipeptidase n=1 Tax=Agrilactobacillus fermenti TaxID=2586909 RepID=UPI003A5BAF2F